MSVRCTLCHRELPETAFYAKSLKRYQHQCKECLKKQNQAYQQEIREYTVKDFDRNYGGYIISILNHPSPYRYAIKGTAGYFFQTNNPYEFLREVQTIIGSYNQ